MWLIVGVADHSLQLAEKYYLMAEAAQEAVDMYNNAGMMEEAYKVTKWVGLRIISATPIIFCRLLLVV